MMVQDDCPRRAEIERGMLVKAGREAEAGGLGRGEVLDAAREALTDLGERNLFVEFDRCLDKRIEQVS